MKRSSSHSRSTAGVFAAVVAGASLLAACGEARQAPNRIAAAGSSTNIDGSEWILSTMETRALIPGPNITLRFDGATAGGYGGCNWYGASYSRAATGIDFSEIASTARACEIPAGVTQQEQRYFRILERAVSFRLLGNRLEILDSAGVSVLLFRRRERLVMNPADLVGTQWVLRSVNDSVQSGQPEITLSFAAKEMSGFGGCRDYSGTYMATGDDIRFTSIQMAHTDCSHGDRARLREGRFTSDLGEAAHYMLGADSLVISTFAGRSLVFRPAR